MAGGLDLGKQVGPLPLGAWIVIVGAGVGIAYTTRGSSPSEPAVVEDTSTDDGVGLGGDFLTTVPQENGNGVQITDNDEWARAAIDYLIGQGYPAAISYSAITTALAGTKLSVQEYALWQVALRGIGTPPTPIVVVPPTSIPGPTIPGTPPAPGIRYVTIKHTGSTLGTIAHTVYGTSSKWSTLKAANLAGKKRADNHTGYIPASYGKDKKLGAFIGRRLVVPK